MLSESFLNFLNSRGPDLNSSYHSVIQKNGLATNRHFLFNVRLQFSLTIFTLQEACLFVYIANDEDSFGNKSLQEQYMKLFLNLKVFNETKLQPSIRVFYKWNAFNYVMRILWPAVPPLQMGLEGLSEMLSSLVISFLLFVFHHK